jgi:hypothetical protein
MEDFIVDFILNPVEKVSSIFGFENSAGSFITDIWQVVFIIFVVLDVILLVALFFTFLVSLKYRPNLGSSKGTVKKILTLKDAVLKERWSSIMKKIEAGTPDAYKVAVIDADKLVDDTLKQLGLEGEHMADRLEKLFPQELRSLDKVWKAHRIRNNLVHNPEFEITMREAKKTLGDYESFLREVKVL